MDSPSFHLLIHSSLFLPFKVARSRNRHGRNALYYCRVEWQNLEIPSRVSVCLILYQAKSRWDYFSVSFSCSPPLNHLFWRFPFNGSLIYFPFQRSGLHSFTPSHFESFRIRAIFGQITCWEFWNIFLGASYKYLYKQELSAIGLNLNWDQ